MVHPKERGGRHSKSVYLCARDCEKEIVPGYGRDTVAPRSLTHTCNSLDAGNGLRDAVICCSSDK
ncbi:hypothetical protein C0J52_06880 [Blattella germanica]|nr:hypothetical protein C0J52_06880 [Blattella germanica]